MNKKLVYKIARNLAIFSFAIVILGSCKKNENSVGSDFLKGEVFNTGIFRQSKIKAYTTLNDSVVTSSPAKNLWGIYQDPSFGLIEAGFGVQVGLTTLDPKFGDNAIVDSVILVMPYLHKLDTDGKADYDTDSIYGDASKKLSLNISELNKYLHKDKIYYSFVDLPASSELYKNTDFNSNFDTIALYTHFLNYDPANEVSSRIDTTKIPASFRVKLDKNFFQTRIIDAEGQPELQNNADFIRYFNGLVFDIDESNYSNAAVYTFDMLNGASLIIYYQNKEDLDDANEDDYDETKYVSRSYTFDFNPNYSNVNKYTYDRSLADPSLIAQLAEDEDSRTGSDVIFLQGLAGLEADVILFDKDQLKALRDSNWLINEANIVFRVNQNNDSKIVAPPYRLYVFNKDSIGTPNYRIIDEVVESPTVFGGFYANDVRNIGSSKEKGIFKFRITNHIHEVLNSFEIVTSSEGAIDTIYKPNFPIKLVSATGKESPTRVMLNSSNISPTEPEEIDVFLEIHHSSKQNGRKK